MQTTNGAKPIILHFPGVATKNYETWDYLKALSIKSKFTSKTEDLTVITWNSTPEKSIVEVVLQQNNVPHIVLGKGDNNWRNVKKINLTLDALKSINTKYVLATDSSDVLYLDSPDKALEKFKIMNAKMLFNSECLFWPNCGTNITETWRKYESGVAKSEMQYLNSGMWIGELDFCKSFLEKCSVGVSDLIASGELPEQLWKSKTCESDQVIMHRVWHEHFRDTGLTLDYHNEIFLNLANRESVLTLPIHL